MTQAPTPQKAISIFIQAAYLAFITSFIFSFRAITSISIAIILIGEIINISLAAVREIKQPFFILLVAFYVLQFVALFYTTDTHEGWNNIRLKSGLIFIPLAMYSSYDMPDAVRKRLIRGYCIVLAIASLYCLLLAVRHYTEVHSRYVLFYHELVSPLKQHAVYFSIFVFIALAYLLTTLRKKEFIFNKTFHFLLIAFFSFFLLLLSSKMVIVYYAIFLVWYLFSLFKKHKGYRTWILSFAILFIIAGCTVMLTTNPISQRFNDILRGDIRFILRDKFDRADYFNGVQFRLLQWRLVPEILTENKAWITGVGPGDAQHLLDKQYISKNMYQGDPARPGSKGYLSYNTHNQFLQSLLQTGITGAILFLLITFTLARMAWRSRSSLYIFIVALLIVYSLIESVFETQYGILLYTFFPLFMKASLDKQRPTNNKNRQS